MSTPARQQSIWVINGYQLGLTIGIVPLAAAGDILGYWRVFRIGLIVFVAGLARLLLLARSVERSRSRVSCKALPARRLR